MFRKITFVLATTAALGAVAFAPTSASAWGKGGGGGGWGGGGWHHGGWGWGGVAAGIGVGLVGSAIVASSCYRREVVPTAYGPVVRWVNYCY
jgi:hypothetical protein